MEKTPIMWVDDEQGILNAVKLSLIREPYDLVLTTSPQEALNTLQSRKFAVIVSDQRMPEMLGTEFLRLAMEIHPDSIRIILSGYSDHGVVTKAAREGAVHTYLFKPWDDAELREKLKQAVEKYEAKSGQDDS